MKCDFTASAMGYKCSQTMQWRCERQNRRRTLRIGFTHRTSAVSFVKVLVSLLWREDTSETTASLGSSCSTSESSENSEHGSVDATADGHRTSFGEGSISPILREIGEFGRHMEKLFCSNSAREPKPSEFLVPKHEISIFPISRARYLTLDLPQYSLGCLTIALNANCSVYTGCTFSESRYLRSILVACVASQSVPQTSIPSSLLCLLLTLPLMPCFLPFLLVLLRRSGSYSRSHYGDGPNRCRSRQRCAVTNFYSLVSPLALFLSHPLFYVTILSPRSVWNSDVPLSVVVGLISSCQRRSSWRVTNWQAWQSKFSERYTDA